MLAALAVWAIALKLAGIKTANEHSVADGTADGMIGGQGDGVGFGGSGGAGDGGGGHGD